MRPRRRSLVWYFFKPDSLALLALVVAALTIYLLYFTPRQRAVRHRLSEADTQSEAAIAPRLLTIQTMFDKGRAGAKPFAVEALSWSGKWALVQETFGIGDRDAHKRFLQQAFVRHVFSEQEVKDALESAVRGYLVDLESIEGKMLVQLRADLEGIGGSAVPTGLRNDPAFRREYEQLSKQVASTLKIDLGLTVGREVGSLIASEVATTVAMQAARAGAAEMGVEAGILSSGVASSIATLGVGLIVAIIIDHIFDAILKSSGYDPAQQIANEVTKSLTKMEASLIRESGLFAKSGSMRAELKKLHENRSQMRREVIFKMLEKGDKR